MGDDCALPGRGAAGRRGIAGTLFVHKARPLASLSSSVTCAHVHHVMHTAHIKLRRRCQDVSASPRFLLICFVVGCLYAHRTGLSCMRLHIQHICYFPLTPCIVFLSGFLSATRKHAAGTREVWVCHHALRPVIQYQFCLVYIAYERH